MSSPTDLPFGIGGGQPARPTPNQPNQNITETDSLGKAVDLQLRAFGLEPRQDDDGDLIIEVSENQLYVKVTEELPGFVRVFGQWRRDPELPGGPGEWYSCAARVSMELPVVKVILVEDGIVVACDAVTPPGNGLDAVLKVCIENVLHGINHWHNYLFELMGIAPEEPGSDAGQPVDGSTT